MQEKDEGRVLQEKDEGRKLLAMQAGLGLLGALTVYCALTLPAVICGTSFCVLYLLYQQYWKARVGHISLTDRIVLITGCDTGFGHELAKQLHGKGCHVIATCYRPEGAGASALVEMADPRMSVLPLDVSSDESVAHCLRKVKGLCGSKGLWALINNAGHNFMGDVELTTMDQYLMVGQINIYGMVRTTRAFLPLLRQAKGRIVNVTSCKALISTPLNAAYNITKYAGETFSEITRMEMKQFGVKVVVIEPGNFGGATGCINELGIKRIKAEYEEMWKQASPQVKEIFNQKYLDSTLRATEECASTTHPTLTPVIDAMIEAVTSVDPEYRYLIDGSNRLFDKYCVLIRLKPFLPDRLFESLVLYFFPYKVE